MSDSARRIGTNRRSLTGYVSIFGSNEAVPFESSLERDWLICLDFDTRIHDICSQPFTIKYDIDGVKRRYTPDIKATYDNGGYEATIVYEVKPREELLKGWGVYRARFWEANRYCRSRGWRFKVVTESHIRTPFFENARFLRRFRSIRPQPVIRMHLLYALQCLGPTTPDALLEASYPIKEERMVAIPVLWKLIAERVIITDLSQKLTLMSSITLTEGA